MSTSRIILVTGANRGIGNGIVERLITASATTTTQTENWTIILACRTKQKAEEAIEEFRCELNKNSSTTTAANLLLYPLELDLASDESIATARQEVETEFGRLDVLINNAGMIERLNPQQTNTRAHFVSTYNINVAAVVVTIQQFLPLLSIQPDPRIINLSSQTGSLQYAATTTHFLTGERGYSVSKAALNRITIDLAKLYPQIGFYCVCPGFCKTNLNGYQGVKSPVEGAWMVEELVVAERGKYGFGFYAFEDGQVINHDW